ncbi:hypothetical protein [Alcanivorax hongdengensis]|nr:hypothetical protein [Alcanivorax hongdengensis]
MEQDDISTFDWVPDELAQVFEDSHADHHSDWQTIEIRAAILAA